MINHVCIEVEKAHEIVVRHIEDIANVHCLPPFDGFCVRSSASKLQLGASREVYSNCAMPLLVKHSGDAF